MRFAYNDPSKREFRRGLRQEQTPAGEVLWQAIRAGKLDSVNFRRQFGVGPFILDFYCTSHRLCIEIDGKYHQEGYQLKYGEERTGFLRNADIWALRFTNAQILDELTYCLESIKAELEASKVS